MTMPGTSAKESWSSIRFRWPVTSEPIPKTAWRPQISVRRSSSAQYPTNVEFPLFPERKSEYHGRGRYHRLHLMFLSRCRSQGKAEDKVCCAWLGPLGPWKRGVGNEGIVGLEGLMGLKRGPLREIVQTDEPRLFSDDAGYGAEQRDRGRAFAKKKIIQHPRGSSNTEPQSTRGIILRLATS